MDNERDRDRIRDKINVLMGFMNICQNLRQIGDRLTVNVSANQNQLSVNRVRVVIEVMHEEEVYSNEVVEEDMDESIGHEMRENNTSEEPVENPLKLKKSQISKRRNTLFQVFLA